MEEPNNLRLSEYQALIKKYVIERGFENESVYEVLALLVEELGELSKAIRRFSGVKVDLNSRKPELDEEAADVFWLLLDLSNRLNIDLGKAFRTKELKNQKRKWV